MRTLIISVLISLTLLFSLVSALGQMEEENQAEQTTVANTDPNAEETSNENAINDPNTINARVKEFEGLEDELKRIDLAGKDEVREWTRRTDERLDLALAVQQQSIAELQFLRQLAVEEGAEKTTAAIDKILLDRKERFKPVIERFEKEKERLRREEEREQREDRGRRERGRRSR